MENMNEQQLLALHRGFFIFGDNTVLKILYQLERTGEKNFTELKEQLGINPATLSKKLKILTEIGIIGSDRTHDNLRVYYSIVSHQKTIRKFLDNFERLANEI